MNLLTVNELAKLFQVHRSTVHAWRKAGCPFIMKAGKWYATVEDCSHHRLLHPASKKPPTLVKPVKPRVLQDSGGFNMSIWEISKELNLSRKAVESIYNSAMRKLRRATSSSFWISLED